MTTVTNTQDIKDIKEALTNMGFNVTPEVEAAIEKAFSELSGMNPEDVVIEDVVASLFTNGVGEAFASAFEEQETKGGFNMKNTFGKVSEGTIKAALVGTKYAGKAFNTAKTIGGTVWSVVKSISGSVWNHLKTHKLAIVSGLGGAIIGGAFTATMGGAVVVGSVVSMATIVSLRVAMNKMRKQKTSYFKLAMEAMDAALWASLTPYMLTYGLAYVTRFFDWAWYALATATINFAVLFMA